MVVRARRILVDRRGGSGPGLAAAAAVCAGGGGGEGSVVVSDAGLVDAVSADASQNPMYRRRIEYVLKYEEEMNEWQLPAKSGRLPTCCDFSSGTWIGDLHSVKLKPK